MSASNYRFKIGEFSCMVVNDGYYRYPHPAHIGGALDESGRSVLPNARYVMGQAEWEFWADEPDLLNLQISDSLRELILTYARKTLPPLREHLELIEPQTEIVPGLEAIAASGHTPGQLALAVSSAEERLLVLADVFLHSIHIEHPEWYSPVDYDPEATVATRRRLFEQASMEGALITAGHLPWPCLGYIHKEGIGWRWQAI